MSDIMWDSIITEDVVLKDRSIFNFVDIEGERLYFDEVRGDGKSYLVLVDRGEKRDILTDYYIRTKASEYGGKSFFVDEGVIYFLNFEDQRIYRKKDGLIEPITEEGNFRYADLVFDKKRGYLYCVQEEVGRESINSIISIDLKSGKKRRIASGRDFYSSIVISNDSKKLAYLFWEHPNMPWDAATLVLADIFEGGSLKNEKIIAGGEGEAVFQPLFSLDNRLYFISDRSGFWNIYRYNGGIENIYKMDSEFGYPAWLFSFSMYGFLEEEGGFSIIASYFKNCEGHLAIIEPFQGKLRELKFSGLNYFFNIKTSKNRAIFKAQSPDDEGAIVLYDHENGKFQIVKRAKKAFDKRYISLPEEITFKSGGRDTFAFYYPPKNPDHRALLPPLIVRAHGGPTAACFPTLNMELQYWTSRGFACLDVNYSGSFGYGREYRDRLKGNWGVADVMDCCMGAQFLIEKGLVDKGKIIIKGGSSGGYTALSALCFTDFFKAGVSYYGISDLEALLRDIHKFESRYFDSLIGKYPEKRELYFKRSPINFLDKFSAPLLLFQGGGDRIVPKEQSERLYRALKEKKIFTSYILFEDEGHGFRNYLNKKRALIEEGKFYNKIFAK